ENASAGCFETNGDFLAWGDMGNVGRAFCACGGVEVNVVNLLVKARVNEFDLNIVAFMNHHHGARNRASKGKGTQAGVTSFVDDQLFFNNRKGKLDNFWPARGDLIVVVDERRDF